MDTLLLNMAVWDFAHAQPELFTVKHSVDVNQTLTEMEEAMEVLENNIDVSWIKCSFVCKFLEIKGRSLLKLPTNSIFSYSAEM